MGVQYLMTSKYCTPIIGRRMADSFNLFTFYLTQRTLIPVEFLSNPSEYTAPSDAFMNL